MCGSFNSSEQNKHQRRKKRKSNKKIKKKEFNFSFVINVKFICLLRLCNYTFVPIFIRSMLVELDLGGN